ncbi:MAG: hypothetical protein Q8T09_01990 [Candidatus Melainabacteria bacterium]|nr:hypothetical protein [Candidatus Melainabacteria bacterium]
MTNATVELSLELARLLNAVSLSLLLSSMCWAIVDWKGFKTFLGLKDGDDDDDDDSDGGIMQPILIHVERPQ